MSTISLPVLQTVRAIIENRYGFAYTDDQLPLLRDRLLAAGGRDGRTLDAMLASLQRGPGGDDADLVQSLTIGETYFFRNSAQYDAIRAVVLPRLLSALGSSGILTVWSAGCATGEEPYSLAILIREAAPQLWPSRVRILATDLNADFLQRAQEGRYTRWSLRQRDEDFVARHFQTQGSTFVVDSRLRDVISFQEHNLQSGRLPAGIGVGQVSLLLCRNVLIYFSQQAWSRALDLFGSALHGDGVMFLGHSETMARHQCWRTQYHPGTFFYLIPQPETPPKAAAQASAPVKVDPEPLPPTRSREVHPRQSSDGADDGVRGLEGPEGGGLLERARAAADAGQWEDAWRDLQVVLALLLH